MRIAYISDPNSINTRRWVNWFARHGHDVCVIADIPLKEAWPGVEVFDLSRRFHAPIIRFPIWSVWVKRILHDWKADILHAHRVNSAGWIGAACGFRPFVVTSWGSDLNDLDLQPSLARPLAVFVVRRAAMITASSQGLLDLAQAFGAAPEKCHCIQWGVDFEYFYPGSAPELRQQLNISTGPVLLSTRAIDSNYNIHVLVDAIPTVLSQFPSATFVLRDYNSNPAYKDSLIDKINNLQIQESVRWLGNITPAENRASAYRMADIAISIPISDSMAISNWEALACGLPLVCSDLPNVREWIVPGENGLVVPVGDSVALADAIISLLSDQDMQNRFSQRGLDLARLNADHQAEMAKMERLYQELLKPKI